MTCVISSVENIDVFSVWKLPQDVFTSEFSFKSFLVLQDILGNTLHTWFLYVWGFVALQEIETFGSMIGFCSG